MQIISGNFLARETNFHIKFLFVSNNDDKNVGFITFFFIPLDAFLKIFLFMLGKAKACEKDKSIVGTISP